MSYYITGDYGPTLTVTVEIEQPVIQTVYEGYDLLVLVFEPFTNRPDKFDLQRKLSTDSEWESVIEDGTFTEARANALGVFAVGNGGLLTDVRIRTRNSDGSEISDWTTAQGTPRQYPSVPEDHYSIDARLFNIGDNLPASYVYKSVINTNESNHTASDYTVVDAPPIGNSFEHSNSDIGAVVFNRDTGVGNRIRTFTKVQYTRIARLYLSINETTTGEVLSAFGVTINETGTGEDTSFRPFAVRPSGTTIAFGSSFIIQGAPEGTIVYIETDYDVNSKEIRFRGWKEGDTIPGNWTSVIINEFVPVGSGYNGILGTVQQNNSSCNVQIHSRTIDGSTPLILDENIGDWSDPSTFETALTLGSVGDWSNEAVFETDLQPGNIGAWSDEAIFQTDLFSGSVGEWSNAATFETSETPWVTINSSSESPSYPVQHSFSEPGTYRIRVIGRKDGRETISPSITITIE